VHEELYHLHVTHGGLLKKR